MLVKQNLSVRISERSTTRLSLAQCLGLGLLGLLIIVALSRYLVLDLKSIDSWQPLAIAAAMLMLALSLVALRYWKNIKIPHAGQDPLTQS